MSAGFNGRTEADMTTDQTPHLAEIPGGPYDLEFFFDTGCPFAWQTSVWIRRVARLRGLTIGWRFISLKFINEGKELTDGTRRAQQRGLEYHRLCAGLRASLGNDAVGRLYKAYGERFWYGPVEGDLLKRLHERSLVTAPAELVRALGLPESLLAHVDDDSWDAMIRAESDEALHRTGPDVGTPILTLDPPDGGSLFGPVISSVPDDETALALYDAMRVFVDFPGFSELKRTARAPLDLPLLDRS